MENIQLTCTSKESPLLDEEFINELPQHQKNRHHSFVMANNNRTVIWYKKTAVSFRRCDCKSKSTKNMFDCP